MFPFEDYEFMRSWWYAHARTGLLSHVTVEDIEEPKGFGDYPAPVPGVVTQYPSPEHDAYDFACRVGTPVVAVHGGL